MKHWIIFLIVIVCFSYGCNRSATKREIFSGKSDDMSVYSYMLKRVFEVEGRQGIATDGQYYYVSGSKALYKYSMDVKLLLKNEKPFMNLEKPVDHIGDIDVYKGEIFAGCEAFADGHGINIQIAIYDSTTLKYKRSIEFSPDSDQKEVSGITVDTDRKVMWMSDWVDGSHIYQYDLRSGVYIRKLHLLPAPEYQQGIFYWDGNLYITADEGDAEYGEHDHMYRVEIDSSDTSTQVTLEKTFTEVKRAGEIEGLTVDYTRDELLVLFNRGARIVNGIPKGFYPGYDREIHEIYVYDMSKK